MRRILIGRNSRLWQQLAADQAVAARFDTALSHSDMASFGFQPDDEIWVLSYSRDEQENQALIDLIGPDHIGRVIYFSTATANVTAITNCYQYPRVKARAAAYAAAQLRSAVIVHLGYVYAQLSDVPSGTTAAVSQRELAQFFRDGPAANTDAVRLFEMIERPHGSGVEKAAHAIYDALQRLCGGFPCLLRPLDVAIRAAGWKWYGYINLSNRLWSSTT